MKKTLVAAAIAALAGPAGAVSLNPDGIGQALIFPYYSVQSSGANPFNTYLSVANHTSEAKAVRVRARESRNGREVASFNLFLAPNDMWTGAIIPDAAGARLITADVSCTSPTLAGQPASLTFQNTFYSGTFSDSNGEGLDRTREGWIEMIEMATLTGVSATNVAIGASGLPNNCAAMQENAPPLVGPPTGGLSGTLTLINVASGQDFTVNADALADVASVPYYRPPTDPYPDFNANEVIPVSVVKAEGTIYRSVWGRGADAVSAVLMRSSALAEFILDAGTRSRSDIVVTFPTRHYFTNVASANPPFTSPAVWAASCTTGSTVRGERFEVDYFDRNMRGVTIAGGSAQAPAACAASSVIVVNNGRPDQAGGVLGSASRGGTPGASPAIATTGMESGWMALSPTTTLLLTSQPSSTRMDSVSGDVTLGSHAFIGLPMVGLSLRTFDNGTLVCDAGSCLGTYGGAFPLKFSRSIAP